jgi:hypothetical protein
MASQSRNNPINATATDPEPTDDLSLVPPPGLIAPSRDPKDPEKSVFALFTVEWLNLQNFTAGALQLPVAKANFTTKYGDFWADPAEQTDVNNCLRALKAVVDAATDFGDPKSLVQQLDQLMSADDPPTALYGLIVWNAYQISNAAQTFSSTFEVLMTKLDDAAGLTKDQRKQLLTDAIGGEGGLIDTAQGIRMNCNDLITRMGTFATKMNATQAVVDQYASPTAKIYTRATDLDAQMQQEAASLQQQVDRLEAEYIGWCSGAGIGAGVIMVVTLGFGWPLAVADAAGFSYMADQTRQAKETTQRLLNAQRDKAAKVVSLVFDLGKLQTWLTQIKGQFDGFIEDLQTIEGVWANIINKLNLVRKDTNIDKLLTLSAINEEANIQAAKDAWGVIVTKVDLFTEKAFVSYIPAS